MPVQIISMWTVDPPQAKFLNVKGIYVAILHSTHQIIN